MTKFLILVLAISVAVQARPHDPEQYGFSWEDCGTSSSPIKFYNIKVTPDPVTMPGNAYLSFDVEAKQDITNLDMKLTLKKKILLTYWTIPCINGVGSCTYNDLCSYMDGLPDPPLTCPVSAGRVTKENVQLPLPDPGSLGGLLSGQYLARAKLNDPTSGNMMGCLEIKLKINT